MSVRMFGNIDGIIARDGNETYHCFYCYHVESQRERCSGKRATAFMDIAVGRERVREPEENKRAHALADFDDLLLFGRWRGSKRRQIRAHNASRRALGGPHCRPRMDTSLAHAHKQSAPWPTRRLDTVWVRVYACLDW